MLQAVLRNPHTYHELLRTKTYVLTCDLLDAYVQLTSRPAFNLLP